VRIEAKSEQPAHPKAANFPFEKNRAVDRVHAPASLKNYGGEEESAAPVSRDRPADRSAKCRC
jgi:hypothetical protein